MRRSTRIVGWLFLLWLASRGLAGEAAETMKPGDVQLTIYSSGISLGEKTRDSYGNERSPTLTAVVRECRAIALPEGVSEYRFADIAEQIDAATLRFADLTDPQGTRVLEQSFAYDLVNSGALLRRFLDRPVDLVDGRGDRHSGKLLSADGPLTLRTSRGDEEREAEEAARRGSQAAVPEPPTPAAGLGQAFFEYRVFPLSRPVTLENNETKQIELLAAHDIPVKKVYTYDGILDAWWWESNRTQDETYGTRCRKTVRVNLEFENTRAANLGTPLPAGIVRAYKRDEADGSLEFVGEDTIAHTPTGERTRLYFGDAFDLVGERKRTAFQRPAHNQVRESFLIPLRNHKDAPVTVQVYEHLYRWLNWKIEASSLPFKQLDSRTVEFAVPVPARGETQLTYTVLYDWPERQ